MSDTHDKTNQSNFLYGNFIPGIWEAVRKMSPEFQKTARIMSSPMFREIAKTASAFNRIFYGGQTNVPQTKEPIALPSDNSKSVYKQNELNNLAWKKANEARIIKAKEKKSNAITRLHAYDTRAQNKATSKGKPLSKNELLNMVKSELIKCGYHNPTAKTAPFREWYKLLSDDIADHWNSASKSVQTS